MDGLLNPEINPELFADRGPHIIAACTTLIILPTVAVLLRLASRWMSRAGFWWDDYLVVLAMILAWGPNIINIVAVQKGFGKHIAVLPINAVFVWLKYLYAFEFTYELAVNSVKFSILLFQYRIFPVRQYRRIFVGLLFLITAQLISFVLVSTFQCVPVHDFWDTLARELPDELVGHCINVQVYFITSGAINTLIDFIILALPIPLLWHLRTSRLQKLILTAIFTVGLTVCIVSIVRLVVLSNLNEADITWNYVPAGIWTAAEPSIAVVSACLPSLRPLFVRLVWGRSYRPKPASASTPNKSFTTFSWRSSSNKEAGSDSSHHHHHSPNGNFNRLRDGDEMMMKGGRDQGPASKKPWTNNVDVRGGRGRDSEEEFEIGSRDSGGRVLARGIHVRTTVTVSETVEWRDDLF